MFLKRYTQNYTAVLEQIGIAALLLFALYIHTRGFPTPDEGWILQAGKRLFEGEVPYKDFQFVYHPGVLYVQSAAFFAFGTSVLSSRLFAFFNTVITSYFLYVLSKRYFFATSARIGMLSLFIFWGAGHINFVWPVIFCLTTGIASVLLWDSWLKKNSAMTLIIIGACIGLTLLFKQNFGVAIAVANIIFILLIGGKNTIAICIKIALGFFGIVFLQLLYFIYTQSFNFYQMDMQQLLVEKIIMKGVFNSALPWQYAAPLAYKAAKALFYFLPLLITTSAGYFSLKKKNYSVYYFSLLTGAYFCLSFRPTTDYIHLTPLLAMSSFLLVYQYTVVKHIVIKNVVLLALSLLTTFGLYSCLQKNYYRWDAPLSSQGIFNAHPRMLIHTDEKSLDEFEEITYFFSQNSGEEKYLFVYSFAPTFNFVTDKKNPTKFDYLHTGVLSPQTESTVIENLKTKNCNYILSDVAVAIEKDSIAKYILENYSVVKGIGKYTIWQKN